MYLKSLSGRILFEGRFHSMRQGVEQAVADGVDLARVNLRNVNLINARLDDGQLQNACLWGADLSGADMAGCDLSHADLRTANMSKACLAQAKCQSVDFSGAYFAQTILTGADLSDAKFSCPTIFACDLTQAATLKDALYCHRGEHDCDLSAAPIIIQGLEKPLIFMNDKVLVGAELKDFSFKDIIFKLVAGQTSDIKNVLKQNDHP